MRHSEPLLRANSPIPICWAFRLLTAQPHHSVGHTLVRISCVQMLVDKGAVSESCPVPISYLSAAMIEHHDQKQLWTKEFVVAYSSRGDESFMEER